MDEFEIIGVVRSLLVFPSFIANWVLRNDSCDGFRSEGGGAARIVKRWESRGFP